MKSNSGWFKSTHGLSRHPLYYIWRGLINRTKPTYKGYGDRGIRLCEEWKNFVTFYRWWAKDYNLKPGTLWHRLNIQKYPIEKALTKTVLKGCAK